MHYYTGWSVSIENDRRKADVVVFRAPWWCAALDVVADLLCRLSLHHYCMTWERVTRTTEKRTEEFRIPSTPEVVNAYNKWHWGSPAFWDKPEDVSEYDSPRWQQYMSYAVNYLLEHPEQRRGQAYFNALWLAGETQLCDETRGTHLDPFNDDNTIPDFLEFVKSAMKEEGAASVGQRPLHPRTADRKVAAGGSKEANDARR